MFGIKIISNKKYQHDRLRLKSLSSANNELILKCTSLENDIQSLRDQNSNLRRSNTKRIEENNSLAEKNSRLKERLQEKRKVKFDDYFTLCTPEHCDTCTHEQEDCKKYHLMSAVEVVCICPKHPDSSNIKNSKQ